MSAEERRETVLRAASQAFAERGYEGTSTEDIAKRADISQPYVFRLFGSKKELFIAVVNRCFSRTVAAFDRASRGLEGEAALKAMGMAYFDLISDPAALLIQMHSFTASANDPEIRSAAQSGMRAIWTLAEERSGLDSETLKTWLAMGMLCNVVAALKLDQVDDAWAAELRPSKVDEWVFPAAMG